VERVGARAILRIYPRNDISPSRRGQIVLVRLVAHKKIEARSKRVWFRLHRRAADRIRGGRVAALYFAL